MGIFDKRKEDEEREDLIEDLINADVITTLFNQIDAVLCIADYDGNILKLHNGGKIGNPQTIDEMFDFSKNKELQENIKNTLINEKKFLSDVKLEKNNEEINSYVAVYKLEESKKILVYIKDTNSYYEKEEDLLKEIDRQEEFIKSKDLFIANLSHEVRTPINIIVGMTYFLKDTVLDEKQLEYVTKLDEASNLLLEMVNGILDLSESKDYSIVNARTDFNLKNFLDNMIQMFEPRVKEKDLKLYVNLNIDSNININADKSRLSQVFINLLENAIKYTDKGFIELDAKKIEENNISYRFQFCLKDTGIGIKKEDSLRIFREFSQVDDPTRKTKEGKGMGLAIAKKIVEDMNGKMWVESSMGLGSKFYFNITVDKSNKVYEELDENIVSEKMPSVENQIVKFDTEDKKILLVEDNEMNIEITKKIIEELDIACDVAKDGLHAIRTIKEKGNSYYDLILMDIHMPKYNGYEISKILKKDLDVKTSIVALTATNVTDEIRKENASYIIDYILKPIQPAVFKEKIKSLVLSEPILDETTVKKHVLLYSEDESRLNLLKAKLMPYFEIATTRTEVDVQILLETGFVDVLVFDEIDNLDKEFSIINEIRCDERFAKIPVILINKNEYSKLKEIAYSKQISTIVEKFEIDNCGLAIKNILAQEEKEDRLEDIIEETKEENKNVYNFLFESMVNLTTSKSKETGEHLKRTKEYMKTMTAKYEEFYKEGLYTTNEIIEDVAMAAVLHDIGKIGIPDIVLNKPGKLNDEEYEIIKSHVTIGKNILETTYGNKVSNNILNYAKDIVYHHHEKFDGTGYPEGLVGDDISVNSRIMAVIDVYDALVNERVYKKAMPYEDAEAFIISQAGTAFDPKVINIFSMVKDELRKINEDNKDTAEEK